MSIKRRFLIFAVIFAFIFSLVFVFSGNEAFAESDMPFYDLMPKEIVLRSEFYTNYSNSSSERKNNISVAAKALDKTFIDVGGEFSFNRAVGPRTEKRGYKSAKIIVNGEFTDGVGGGVCQVSTTLYNAFLLAGLRITEYHPHSLAVSYVALSFDAMVNSGSADLRCVNVTKNPIIIRTFADGNALRVKIYGEPMREKYYRESVTIKEIEPTVEILKDEAGEFNDLYEGQRRVLSYGKKGYVTEGYVVKTINGRQISRTRIRKDRYGSIKSVIIEGTKEIDEERKNDARKEETDING